MAPWAVQYTTSKKSKRARAISAGTPPSIVLPSVSLHTQLPSVVSTADSTMVVPTLTTQSVSGLRIGTVVNSSPPVTQAATLSDAAVQCRGKASPINAFTEGDVQIWFDDWLRTLERATTWTESELLMQLAGYLHGRALKEWNLMSQSEHRTCKSAITGLRARLDPSNKTLASLDLAYHPERIRECF